MKNENSKKEKEVDLKLLLISTEESFEARILIERGDELMPEDELYSSGKCMILTPRQVQEMLPTAIQLLNTVSQRRRMFSTAESMQQLKEIICDEFRIHVDQLNDKTRKKEVVVARQLLFSILKWKNYGSLSTIGTVAGKDHATVIHAERTILNYLFTKDRQFFTPIINVLNLYQMPIPFKR